MNYEIRMMDSVVNTGLDGAIFSDRTEAQAAAELVNAEYPRARAEVIDSQLTPNTTYDQWAAEPWE